MKKSVEPQIIKKTVEITELRFTDEVGDMPVEEKFCYGVFVMHPQSLLEDQLARSNAFHAR